MNPDGLDEVHDFWFGTLEPETFPAAMAERWFRVSEAFDREIRERFAAAIDLVTTDGIEVAAMNQRQKMGLVILLDQFPRNLHRSSGEAFAHDREARAAARAALKHGLLSFHPAEQMFLTLPFQHSEEIADQDLGVFLAAQAAVAAAPGFVEPMRGALDFATRHRDVIRRFGRFPHRNTMLGRTSTPEEAAFLKEHGRGY